MSDDLDPRELAALFAVDALDDVERARLLRALREAPTAERADFDAEVASIREALADLSATTAVPPPPALRARLLEDVDDVPAPAEPARRDPRRIRLFAAAAAATVLLGAGGVVLGYTLGGDAEPVAPTTAEQIFAAPDVRTTSGDVAGGRATITYSPTAGEGILVMNQVPSPAPGTIYQMWLDGPDGPRLAGTMSETDVAPSTTAVIHDIGGATAVSFTVGDAATPDKMIGEPVATLPLS
ncbi:anti-sigma factor [Gordonia alkaliphila]|uniref:Regulator of SigK n=1 Tax=Gordonia alkaliphila TaxID=1053547 RepID=A0ABP8YY51_9ACTN